MLTAASDKVAALETVDTGRGVKSALSLACLLVEPLARSPTAAGFQRNGLELGARPRNPRGQFGLLAEDGRRLGAACWGVGIGGLA